MKPTSPTGTVERRIFTLDRIELRAGENGARILDGHAAVFNKDSVPMYGFTERIAAGTFTRAIKEDDVRALFNHDPNLILGRNTAKTLRLVEDDSGLLFSVDLPDTQMARDLAVSIERRDVTGCSFSFCTIKDQWEYNEDGSCLRTLLEAELYDVGPVTFPAYPDTDVSVRSLQDIAAEGKRRLAEAIPQCVPLALRRLQIEQLERIG